MQLTDNGNIFFSAVFANQLENYFTILLTKHNETAIALNGQQN